MKLNSEEKEVLNEEIIKIKELPLHERLSIFREEIISMLTEAEGNPNYVATQEFVLLLQEFETWFDAEMEVERAKGERR